MPSEVTTGVPWAMASSTGRPKPSSQAREAEQVGAGVERRAGRRDRRSRRVDPSAEPCQSAAEVLVPTLGAGEDQVDVGAAEPLEGREQARRGSCGARWCRSRARSGRRCRSGPARRRPPRRRRPCGVDAPRHEAQAGGVEAVAGAVVERGLRRAHHEGGVAAGELDGRGGRSRTPRRVNCSGSREERQVVDGHHQRRRRRRAPPSPWRGSRRPGRWPARPPGAAASATTRTAPAGAAAGPRRGSRGAHAAGGGALWRALRRRARGRSGPTRARTDSRAARAVPPGTACQHCSRVTATRRGRSMGAGVSHDRRG